MLAPVTGYASPEGNRNTALALAGLGAYFLFNGNTVPGIASLAGAGYAYNRYQNERDAQRYWYGNRYGYWNGYGNSYGYWNGHGNWGSGRNWDRDRDRDRDHDRDRDRHQDRDRDRDRGHRGHDRD